MFNVERIHAIRLDEMTLLNRDTLMEENTALYIHMLYILYVLFLASCGIYSASASSVCLG